ncbi:MAG: PaaI family thioesterase [Pseudomonadota bacterium]
MTEAPDSKADESVWRSFDFTGTGTWPELWPAVLFRTERPDFAHFRVDPPAKAGNKLGGLHGAFLAGLAENCLGILFYAATGRPDCVTVSMAIDYPDSGHVGAPIDGEVELMRETGRMQFLRIVLRQGDAVLVHGTGVMRKVTAR